jgi:hypothetical protein
LYNGDSRRSTVSGWGLRGSGSPDSLTMAARGEVMIIDERNIFENGGSRESCNGKQNGAKGNICSRWEIDCKTATIGEAQF